MSLYLNCALQGLIGLAFSLLLSAKLLVAKAKSSNQQFNWGLFLSSDLIFQTLGNILAVLLGFTYLGPVLKEYPALAQKTLSILAIFGTLGFTGSILVFLFFSAVRNRIENGIAQKSANSDAQTGDLNSPTPAPKK